MTISFSIIHFSLVQRRGQINMLIFKFICIILIYICYIFTPISCSDSIRTWTFQMHSNLPASSVGEPTASVIRETRSLRSKVQCATACASSYFGDQCQSFQVQESSGTCRLMASKDGVDAEGQDEGWRAYRVVQFAAVPTPFTDISTDIVGNMRTGMMVNVTGVFNSNPTKVVFSFGCDTGWEVDTALFFALRFQGFSVNNVAVRSTRINGKFGNQQMEPSGTNFPFYPDQDFEVAFIAEATRFQIIAHGHHFAYYNYRIKPLERVISFSAKGHASFSLFTIQ